MGSWQRGEAAAQEEPERMSRATRVARREEAGRWCVATTTAAGAAAEVVAVAASALGCDGGVCVCVGCADPRLVVGGGQVCGRVGGYRGLVVVEAACGLPGPAAPVLGSLCPPHLSRAVCRDRSDKTRPNYAGLVQQFEFWAGRVAPLCRPCQGTNCTKKTQSHLCVARKWIQMDSLPLGFRWDFWKGLRSPLVGGGSRRLPAHSVSLL